MLHRDMLILSHERLKTLAKSPEESEIAGVHSDIRGYDLYYPGTLNPHEVLYRDAICGPYTRLYYLEINIKSLKIRVFELQTT